MGKYLTSLLIVASSVLLPDGVFADEQVRRVQEELRKRHLFYANPNGEKGPALTTAVRRYQQKKGFPATGVIDSVTLSSLGISSANPPAATTPVVVGQLGQVYGANGERLPSHPPSSWPDQRVSKYDPAFSHQEHLELALEDFWLPQSQPPRTFRQRVSQMSVHEISRAGFQNPFDPTSERIRDATPQPPWNTLVLRPPAEGSEELDIVGDESPQQAALRPNRKAQRRARSVKPRQEKNPFVLTYQSVNRAFRSLFGDTATKKKRSTSKRL
jgi:peptidoglycan hydrolase-like protein with peptidoglycan-binding domain